MKKTILCMSVLCLTSLPAFAEHTKNNGYLTDTNGNIVKSGTGLCIRTGFWTPADAVAECDPDLIKKDPEVITPTPIPPTVITPVPPPPTPTAFRKVIPADVLFGFDKSNITPKGEDVLSQLIEQQKTFSVTHIEINGYTDPIGSDSYNQALSEKRANSVRQYFIEHGYDTNIIHSEGKGESNLLVTKENCKAQKLIACYAPNRRVEIEFVIERRN